MSWMKTEALACAEVAERIARDVQQQAWAEGRRWRERAVPLIEVLGRGSSSHAGSLVRYALARHTQCVVSAAMPWRGAAEAAAPQAIPAISGSVLIAISQSGGSPDLLRYCQSAAAAGMHVVGIINHTDSPLARACATVLPMSAGVEHAVAATKTTVAAGVVGLALTAGAAAHQEDRLSAALRTLPERLFRSQSLPWSALSALLPDARCVFVIGRAATLGVAKELALKIAETTGTPAMAYSSAEFLHGPLGATSPQTLVLGLSSDPAAHHSVLEALAKASLRGAPTLVAGIGEQGLPTLPAEEPFTDALAMLVPAYLAIEAAAQAMGQDPDAPRGLSKVTQTR